MSAPASAQPRQTRLNWTCPGRGPGGGSGHRPIGDMLANLRRQSSGKVSKIGTMNRPAISAASVLLRVPVIRRTA